MTVRAALGGSARDDQWGAARPGRALRGTERAPPAHRPGGAACGTGEARARRRHRVAVGYYATRAAPPRSSEATSRRRAVRRARKPGARARLRVGPPRGGRSRCARYADELTPARRARGGRRVLREHLADATGRARSLRRWPSWRTRGAFPRHWKPGRRARPAPELARSTRRGAQRVRAWAAARAGRGCAARAGRDPATSACSRLARCP